VAAPEAHVERRLVERKHFRSEERAERGDVVFCFYVHGASPKWCPQKDKFVPI
jgi:hypothetical protein